MNTFTLSTFRVPENTCIPQAQPKVMTTVTSMSSALDVMIDLAQVKSSTIDPRTTLARAKQVMTLLGVRILFVVRDFPCVEGLVTVTDLVGEKPTRLVSQRNGRYQDLCVADIMTELSMLDALDFDQLKLTSVGRVIDTFKQLGRDHLLVVQAASVQFPACIRGVISLTQLARQLQTSIVTTEIARTFVEIEQVLN